MLLWAAAAPLLWQPRQLSERDTKAPPSWISLPAGAVLALLAGLTGTGGGRLCLSPLDHPRCLGGAATEDVGLVAAFIFLNSVAGLAGNAASVGHLPRELPIFLAAGWGGRAAPHLARGRTGLPRPWLLGTLGAVLTVAGAKLLFTLGQSPELPPVFDATSMHTKASHRPIDALEHVEQGRARDRDTSQCLHFDAGDGVSAKLRNSRRKPGSASSISIRTSALVNGGFGWHSGMSSAVRFRARHPPQLGGRDHRALGRVPRAHLLRVSRTCKSAFPRAVTVRAVTGLMDGGCRPARPAGHVNMAERAPCGDEVPRGAAPALRASRAGSGCRALGPRTRSQGSRQAPVDPGRRKVNVSPICPAKARECGVDNPTVVWLA